MSRKAIVLGGHKGSIGTAIANELARREWMVVHDHCYVGHGGPQNEGGRQYAVPDMTDDADAVALVVALGRTGISRFHEQPDETTEDVLRACLTMPLQAAKQFITMRRQRGNTGHVVFIGSYNATHPLSHGTAYSAAKAGLAMACRSLAWDYTVEGWVFNILHPYLVPGTPMSDEAQVEAAAAKGIPLETVKQLAQQSVLVTATPEGVAIMVASLLEMPGVQHLSGSGLDMFGGVR